MSNAYPYTLAQRALTDLKAAVYETLTDAPNNGLTNAQIGRSLGIYHGHIGHEGHIPRTALTLIHAEGVISQDRESKRWALLTLLRAKRMRTFKI